MSRSEGITVSELALKVVAATFAKYVDVDITPYDVAMFAAIVKTLDERGLLTSEPVTDKAAEAVEADLRRGWGS